MLYVLLFLLITLMGAFASYFLKKSSGGVLEIIKSPYFYVGGFLYVIAAVINVYILQFMDYTKVLPLTSLTYVWTLVIARIFLKESIEAKQYLGVLFIVCGALVISL